MLYYNSLLVMRKPVKPKYVFPGGANFGAWLSHGKVADANMPGGECWLIEDTNSPTDGITIRITFQRNPSEGYVYRVRFRYMTDKSTQLRFSLCPFKATSAGVYGDFNATFTVPTGGGGLAGRDYFDLTLPNHLPNKWLRISDVIITPEPV